MIISLLLIETVTFCPRTDAGDGINLLSTTISNIMMTVIVELRPSIIVGSFRSYKRAYNTQITKDDFD